MSGGVALSRRLQVLFLVALLGALTCVGLAVVALAGPVPGLAYAVVAAGLLALGAARARAAASRAEQARRASGRTCTCCTTSQHDPVKVI